MTIYRPGHHVVIPGARVLQPGGAAVPWWLSGGINPANAIAAYQPKGAANYAASKVNLANPGTYDATEGIRPTWDATNGWTFNGAQWLDTGYSLTSAIAALVQFTGSAEGAFAWVLGSRSADSSVYWGMTPVRSAAPPSQHRWWNSNGSPVDKIPAIYAGNMAILGTACYVNGALVTNITLAAYTNKSVKIATFQPGFGYWMGNIQAVALYTTLTPGQGAAVAAAMAAL